MKFCKNCGHQLTDTQKVCTQCGTPVSAPQINPVNETPNVVPPVTRENHIVDESSIHTSRNNNQTDVSPMNDSVSNEPLIHESITNEEPVVHTDDVNDAAISSETHLHNNAGEPEIIYHSHEPQHVTPPQVESTYTAPHDQQVHTATEEYVAVAPKEKKPLSKRTLGLIIGALALLLALAAAYMIMSNRYSPEKTTDRIISAMNAKDAGAMAGLLSSNSNSLSESEAKAFINYIHNKDAVDEFNNQLKTSTNAMLANNVAQSDVYAGDVKALDLSQNGKKFGLFKQYLYDVPAQTVTITPNDDSKLSFEVNGKNYSKSLVKNHEQKLGQFVLGDYSIPATKTVDGNKFKGKLDINMSEGSRVANEAFNLAYIHPSLTSTYGIEEDSIKLYVNGKATDFDFNSYEDKVGPFKSGENVELYAEAEVDGKKFKTDKVSETVNEVEDNEAIDVQLTFDDDEISAYVQDMQEKEAELSESQEEVKSISLDSEHFFTTYMKTNHLNGYRGVNLGMSKSSVEKLLGTADEDFDPFKSDVKKYGNFAVEYDKKDKVKQYYIVPDYSTQMDEEEVEDTYGTPAYRQTTDKGKNIYLDTNRTNGFVIVVVMDDDGYMQYMYQKPEESTDPWR